MDWLLHTRQLSNFRKRDKSEKMSQKKSLNFLYFTTYRLFLEEGQNGKITLFFASKWRMSLQMRDSWPVYCWWGSVSCKRSGGVARTLHGGWAEDHQMRKKLMKYETKIKKYSFIRSKRLATALQRSKNLVITCAFVDYFIICPVA